jgi:hypothetical protein
VGRVSDGHWNRRERVSQAHWAIKTGGWIDNAVWLPDDFNGDGRTDVGVWNDGGLVSIAMFLSNGTKFLSQSPQWGVREGGWMDNVKWFVGDFNADGRTDIGAAWDNEHLKTLSVRKSTGSSFSGGPWAIKAGGWRNSATWCTGQFR